MSSSARRRSVALLVVATLFAGAAVAISTIDERILSTVLAATSRGVAEDRILAVVDQVVNEPVRISPEWMGKLRAHHVGERVIARLSHRDFSGLTTPGGDGLIGSYRSSFRTPEGEELIETVTYCGEYYWMTLEGPVGYANDSGGIYLVHGSMLLGVVVNPESPGCMTTLGGQLFAIEQTEGGITHHLGPTGPPGVSEGGFPAARLPAIDATHWSRCEELRRLKCRDADWRRDSPWGDDPLPASSVERYSDGWTYCAATLDRLGVDPGPLGWLDPRAICMNALPSWAPGKPPETE